MKNQSEPYGYAFNRARLRRDRWIRRTGYRVRTFAKFAPGLLIMVGLVGWLMWALRAIGSPR